MSNNSIPNLLSGVSSQTTIVRNIRTRIDKYLKKSNGDDLDNKIPKLRLTVIRLYFNNLLKLLKEKTPCMEVNQLNFILHSHTLNGLEYSFQERIYKILYFLDELCKNNKNIAYYTTLWHENVVYF